MFRDALGLVRRREASAGDLLRWTGNAARLVLLSKRLRGLRRVDLRRLEFVAGDADRRAVLQAVIVRVRIQIDMIELDTGRERGIATATGFQVIPSANRLAAALRAGKGGSLDWLGEIAAGHQSKNLVLAVTWSLLVIVTLSPAIGLIEIFRSPLTG